MSKVEKNNKNKNGSGKRKKNVIAFNSWKYEHYFKSIWAELKNIAGCCMQVCAGYKTLNCYLKYVVVSI